MEAHDIIRQLHDAFPQITKRLERIGGHSEEWWRSHHREPKTRNPQSSGNCSPVTHFIEYCHLNEAACPGAGLMLANRVHESLMADFHPDSLLEQGEMHDSIISEGCDVSRWLATHDLKNETQHQLEEFQRECFENIEVLARAAANARKLQGRGLRAVG